MPPDTNSSGSLPHCFLATAIAGQQVRQRLQQIAAAHGAAIILDHARAPITRRILRHEEEDLVARPLDEGVITLAKPKRVRKPGKAHGGKQAALSRAQRRHMPARLITHNEKR